MIRGLLRRGGTALARTRKASASMTSDSVQALSTVSTLRQADTKDNNDGDASSYIKDNPELEKILRDLYDDKDRDRLVGAMQTKYDVFVDDDAAVVYDVDEERQRRMEGKEEAPETRPGKYSKYDTSHGASGVFDVEDLVEVLRGERCEDVVVMSVDASLNYVDHMVVATCRSRRHLRSSAGLVRKVYKLRRQNLLDTDRLRETVPRIEGFQDPNSDWLAMDLGNIAIHFFLPETRERYDLESLWGHGPDPQSADAPADGGALDNQMDDLIAESHALLADLEPADSSSHSTGPRRV